MVCKITSLILHGFITEHISLSCHILSREKGREEESIINKIHRLDRCCMLEYYIYLDSNFVALLLLPPQIHSNRSTINTGSFPAATNSSMFFLNSGASLASSELSIK